MLEECSERLQIPDDAYTSEQYANKACPDTSRPEQVVKGRNNNNFCAGMTLRRSGARPGVQAWPGAGRCEAKRSVRWRICKPFRWLCTLREITWGDLAIAKGRQHCAAPGEQSTGGCRSQAVAGHTAGATDMVRKKTILPSAWAPVPSRSSFLWGELQAT